MEDADKYSKMVHGADKVLLHADDFESTPVLAAPAGLEPVYRDMPSCNLFIVRSLFPMQPIPYFMKLPITMTIARDDSGDLTLFNAFRVPEDVENQILALGQLRHVVKLGQFHGAADAYYCRSPKFSSPDYWAAPGATLSPGLDVTRELKPGGPLPIEGAQLYNLDGLPFVENVITVPVPGRRNALIACDALMHLADTSGAPILARLMMNMFGFTCELNAPQPAPIWLMKAVSICGKEAVIKWFSDIVAMDWDTVVCAHGTAVVDCSHEKVTEAVAAKVAAQ